MVWKPSCPLARIALGSSLRPTRLRGHIVATVAGLSFHTASRQGRVVLIGGLQQGLLALKVLLTYSVNNDQIF